nr:MAG TPA: holin [Caudoviricetes sp.]
MDNILEEIGLYFWVILVGLVGGLLNLANSKKSGARRFINAIVGTASSMFVCWLAYETTFYFTQAPKFSLAVGGFFAWRGAEWATAMIDKAVDKRIEGLNDRSYKELGDFGSDFRYEDNKNEE